MGNSTFKPVNQHQESDISSCSHHRRSRAEIEMTSIRVHDVLQTEIQRLQDELPGLTLKMKDTELQMLKKDESIKQLQHDIQECTKELTATHNIFRKVSEERDHMWEEVKRSREAVKLLNHEDKLEHELMAETMLTRVLREKLCSKELEIDQLKADLASSIRVHDVLQTEIQRLQDELSGLAHKMNDTELQMLKKDERIKQLQHDLQECTKELTATHNILRKVSEERDHMWEEVKRSREAVMLLNHEVLSLKKKFEELEEDVLTKEGQISILKGSLGDRPFDIICSPRSVKEFSLE